MSGAPAGEDSYELRTTSTVRRALSETLPEAVAAAAYEFITGPLLADPYRIGKRLLPPMDDKFSARRGTYRVIYRIDDKAHVVTVVDVAHRRMSTAPENRTTSALPNYPSVLLSRAAPLRGAAGPASAPGSAVERPARRTPGRSGRLPADQPD